MQARAHLKILAASTWPNSLYHLSVKEKGVGIDPSTPLRYADRFRIRHPGKQWYIHPPHIGGKTSCSRTSILSLTCCTGGGIERWQEEAFRACFADILSGDWRKHDPYNLALRVKAKESLGGRENLVGHQLLRVIEICGLNCRASLPY